MEQIVKNIIELMVVDRLTPYGDLLGHSRSEAEWVALKLLEHDLRECGLYVTIDRVLGMTAVGLDPGQFGR